MCYVQCATLKGNISIARICLYINLLYIPKLFLKFYLILSLCSSLNLSLSLSVSFFLTGSHVVQAVLKLFYVFKDSPGLLTFCLPLPNCGISGKYQHNYALLGTEPRTLWMLGKH